MAKFSEKMTLLFGSDEAVGVTFVLDNPPGGVEDRAYTAAEVDALASRFGRDAVSGESFLPNGGSGVCCTDYANLIKEKLAGEHVVQVVGFANEDNPDSRVAKEEIHLGGHDFAWVDNRYIVDPWLTLVAAEGDQFVFDSHDPADAKLIREIYGPQDCWSDLESGNPFLGAAIEASRPLKMRA